MGRIDEALRRAGRPRRDQELHRPAGGLFVSPWSAADGDFAGERVSTMAPPPPAAARPAAPWPAKPHRSELVSPIERFAAGWRERLAIGANSDPVLADQFRRLAATLLHVQRTEKLRSVMVTSALAADGKTMTSLNLSLVLSEAYRRRVLLVEGDLRRPAITRLVGLPVGPGLSEALKSNDDRKPSLIQLTETLTLLPAGQPDADPLSALTSPRLQALLQDAAEKFDWVIVDTAPLAATTDATLLCPLVDAALLVVRAGRTPLESINRAVDALGRDRILGIVLNASTQAEAVGYEHYSDTAQANAKSLNLATDN
jgi:capsular exopolysaccharide synthesis family protein